MNNSLGFAIYEKGFPTITLTGIRTYTQPSEQVCYLGDQKSLMTDQELVCHLQSVKSLIPAPLLKWLSPGDYAEYADDLQNGARVQKYKYVKNPMTDPNIIPIIPWQRCESCGICDNAITRKIGQQLCVTCIKKKGFI